MANIPTWLPVVALALFDSRGRMLMQRRPAGRHHAGCWEFPGGKVEALETPREALVREIAEELGLSLDASALAPAHFADDQGARPLVLFLYTSNQAVGRPASLEGQEWAWLTPDEAGERDLAPLDRVLLSGLAK
ncbi:NUDIX domain-containing protein [Aurantiacibacter spongiae]|uniref:8-oxo-dGTP diphosphatase n=1 Tax=Aurantiacibacter spongiae TaxID=2488860 RepID=A0A3N5CW51_9SPHN|nr:(deoxy)nucleoside triphosphate pyrophosphohydrolase [Aurantiacibacter spongiae]RPF72546.1 (deoxy)nucleoside triphosphate pyrophosphohydrolase [Aurantiacibacter spongiae]